jgi:hypothetical protein
LPLVYAQQSPTLEQYHELQGTHKKKAFIDIRRKSSVIVAVRRNLSEIYESCGIFL